MATTFTLQGYKFFVLPLFCVIAYFACSPLNSTDDIFGFLAQVAYFGEGDPPAWDHPAGPRPPPTLYHSRRKMEAEDVSIYRITRKVHDAGKESDSLSTVESSPDDETASLGPKDGSNAKGTGRSCRNCLTTNELLGVLGCCGSRKG